ncbi:glycerophosphodiester phosphodiesterase family protein [Microbacterium sp. cx-59]|uniref:glycerophosphodiester phosphodiesterase family protein n=1 Tax=Microbacterium sp. cx-59 TaxID=2891207 RepID=UPI001E4482BC|nr:glycerophosphodiester phosphodiesterase family protein [Microbacterium sp. cx-59]MCC4907423.1 glycerophosphodiester phosphodiesterase [Microbacterium sp. cx-59]
MTHPYFIGTDVPRVLAHRGLVPDGEKDVAENSFAAVAAAHAAGAVYVESDCHLTADGVVVLSHDEDLRRVTGDPRRLADVSLHELEDLMAPRGGLITLAQALTAFPDLRFNIDVKVAAAAEPAGEIVADHAERVLLTSFSDARREAALAAARATRPALIPATSAGSARLARVLAAVATGSARLTSATLAGLDALQIPERRGPVRVLTKRLIGAAHRSGVEVHVWTVNDVAQMRRLRALGVDGIITDHADIALEALAPPHT